MRFYQHEIPAFWHTELCSMILRLAIKNIIIFLNIVKWIFTITEFGTSIERFLWIRLSVNRLLSFMKLTIFWWKKYFYVLVIFFLKFIYCHWQFLKVPWIFNVKDLVIWKNNFHADIFSLKWEPDIHSGLNKLFSDSSTKSSNGILYKKYFNFIKLLFLNLTW